MNNIKNKIGCLGPEGTFSEEATLSFLKKNNIKADVVLYSSIGEVIDGLKNKKIEMAVVPIENSIEGVVNSALDRIIDEVKSGNSFQIIAEIKMKIIQNLIGLQGAKTNEIKNIYSHLQPLAQCEDFIKNMKSRPTTYPEKSTSDGARIISELKNTQNAVIGSKKLAEIYKLKILKEKINSQENNTTRFVIFGKKPLSKNRDKTSLIFGLKDKPGALLRVLEVFDVFNINMTHISSRPTKNSLGEYVFFVELNNCREDKLPSALKLLEEKVSFLKNLGSYEEKP